MNRWFISFVVTYLEVGPLIHYGPAESPLTYMLRRYGRLRFLYS